MGCDIHGFAEWKWRDAEDKLHAWSLVSPIPDFRHYRVFELLADVRTTGDIRDQFTDSIPLRGIPTIYDSVEKPHGLDDDLGDHSYTWYMLDELRIPKMWEQIEYVPARMLWVSWLDYLAYYRATWYNCDIRIVMGFDN